MFLYSDSDVRSIDEAAIRDYHITALQLQESAAMLLYNALINHIQKKDKGVVVVGRGNNGADGLALSRMLFIAGFDISIYYLTDEDGSAEYEAQKEIVSTLGLKVVSHLDGFDYLIDALIGVGCKKDLKPEVIDVINSINSLDLKVFSLDMPTGVGFNSNAKECIKAQYTFTLGVSKAAMYLKGNRAYCGDIKVLTPLFPLTEKVKGVAKLVDIDSLSLKKFLPNAYKKTRGDLIIVGSSKEYPSTVLLSSRAAFLSGIGLVTIYTDKEVAPKLYNENPALMVRPFSDFKADDKAVLLLGPGLGSSNDDVLLPFLKLENKKVVDADGIRAYSRLYKEGRIGRLTNAIMTPHLGELKALLDAFGLSSGDTPNTYLESIKKLAHLTGATLVVKSEVASITDGDKVNIVDLVNPSLAVAGSGDVLASVIAVLYVNDDKAALTGVLLHKKAGIDAQLKYGYYSALELIEAIGQNR